MAVKMKIESREGGLLVWMDRANGEEFARFNVNDVSPDLRQAVYEYGCKQILSDAMAGKHDAWSAFRERADALRDGTWGQRKSGLPDQLIFAALVGLGLVPDSEDVRAKWRERKPSERAALGRRPDVAKWIADNAEASDAADSILNDLLNGE